MKFAFSLVAAGTIAACLLPLTAGAARAQAVEPSLLDLYHTAWGERDGLPVTGASRLAHTPDGYLWLGSTNGLLRFDGVRFATMDSSRAPQLQSTLAGETRPLLVDRSGILWVGLSDGALAQYKDGKFRVVAPPDTARGAVYRLAEDGLGRLWFVANGRLYTWEKGRLDSPVLPAGVPDSGVMGAIADTGSGLWIGTNSQGLWHVTAKGARQYWNPSTPIDLSVRPLLQDRDGTLWVWGDRLQAMKDDRWSRIELNHVGIAAADMAQAPDGSLWFATRGHGVLRLRDGHLEQFTERDGLSDAVVSDVLVDDEHNAWAYTDGGLDRFRAAPFTTIGPGNGLPFDSPLVIHGDADGSIWAMAAGTSQLYHLDGGMVRRKPGAVVATLVPAPRDDAAYPVGVGRHGGVWVVGRKSGRLAFYRDGRPAAPLVDPTLGGRVARQVLEDSRGNTWVAVHDSGFGRLKNLRYVPRPLPLPGKDSNLPVVAVVEDGTGRVWAAVANHPVVFAFLGDSVVGRLDSTTGLTEPVTLLAAQGRDTLWASAGSGHLMRIVDGRAQTLSIPSIARILAVSSQVLVADEHDLWFASEAGIGKASLADLNAMADGRSAEVIPRFYSAVDGLEVGKVTRFNQAPAFRARDGRLWFATPSGLAVVDPGSAITNLVPPQVHIEEASVAGQRIPMGDSALAVPPNPDRLELRYTATGLRVPERMRVQYQLLGVDRDWVEGNATRTATYTQLRPGNYRFRVRAWNEDGVPSASGTMIAVRVTPTWYQTWWFRLGLVLAILGAGAGALVLWLRARARRKVERMRAAFDAALAERTRLARDLHDTLLQGFTGITLQLQAARHSLTHSPAEADATLSRVLDLADTTLRDARLMVWDMRAPELDHQDLAQALESAANNSVAGLDIDVDFVVNGSRRRLPLSTETAALRIGREAIVNAVKHAAPSRIRVELFYEPRTLRLSVRDNGSGFEPSAEHLASNGGHFGLKGMRERASRAGGTLQINGSAQGTTLSLDLPTE